MTLPEWIELQAMIVAFWPHAQVADRRAVGLQHELVADLPRDAAAAAIATHARSGHAFPPTPGQIHEAATSSRVGAAPSWPAALSLVRAAAARHGRDREARALADLASRSVHVAEWACEHGWRQICTEPIDDPQHGGATAQRLERSYRSHCTQVDREIAQGRAPSVAARRIAALEARTTTPATGLRRLSASVAQKPAA